MPMSKILNGTNDDQKCELRIMNQEFQTINYEP